MNITIKQYKEAIIVTAAFSLVVGVIVGYAVKAYFG